MKTISVEKTTLDGCLHDAQQERLVVTRGGRPVALIVGLEGLDDEQIALAKDEDFWKLIAECRRQKTISRAELESRLASPN